MVDFVELLAMHDMWLVAEGTTIFFMLLMAESKEIVVHCGETQSACKRGGGLFLYVRFDTNARLYNDDDF